MLQRIAAATALIATSLLALWGLAAPPPASAASTGMVLGYVIDRATNAKIAGATVTVAGATTTTNASGCFFLSPVPLGTQTVTASAFPYGSASMSVSVGVRSTSPTPTLKLAENWGALSGTVTDVMTGAALSGATVAVAGTPLTATTDGAGRYAFARAPAGPQTVTASAVGHPAPLSQAVTVPLGGSVDLPLALPGSTIPWNGTNSYLLGANYAWWNYGTDFGTGGWGKYTDWGDVADNFAAMHAQGVRVVRWWVFADGRYSPDFSADGTVSGLDASFLPDIDRALQIAADSHIVLLLTVMDSSMWSGANYSGAVELGGHAGIVTDPLIQQSFLDGALKPLLLHVAASPNRTAVLGYDLVNEPESQMAGYFNWGGASLDPGAVKVFVHRCAAYVHLYGGGASATVGSAAPYYVATWKNLGLDFYQLHYYPGFDYNGPGSGLPTFASLSLDRPCIVGEFASNDTSYGLTDTNPLSAEWYLNTIHQDGYAGALAWSYSGGDSASNWDAFHPVLTDWAQSHAALIGP